MLKLISILLGEVLLWRTRNDRKYLDSFIRLFISFVHSSQLRWALSVISLSNLAIKAKLLSCIIYFLYITIPSGNVRFSQSQNSPLLWSPNEHISPFIIDFHLKFLTRFKKQFLLKHFIRLSCNCNNWPSSSDLRFRQSFANIKPGTFFRTLI